MRLPHALVAIVFILGACTHSQTREPIAEPPMSDTPTASPTDVPSFGIVNPSAGALNRQLQVQILLENLMADASATATFGEGIMVGQIAATAPGSLTATLVIAADATIGPRDVTVSFSGQSVIGKGAFQVIPSLEVSLITPIVSQGAFLNLYVTNLDPSTAFDPTFALTAPGLSPIYNGALSGTYLNAGAIVAPKADLGPITFQGSNSSLGMVTDRFASGPTSNVVAKTPIEFSGPLTGQTLSAPGVPNLYHYSGPPVTGLVTITMSSTSSNLLWPVFWVFGEGGKSEDYIGVAAVSGVTSGQPKVGSVSVPSYGPVGYYIIADDYDDGAGADHIFSLDVTTSAAVGVEEATAGAPSQVPGQSIEPTCVVNNALVSCVLKGEISTVGETDVYTVSGLSALTNLELSLQASGTVEAWAQDGSLPSLATSSSEFGHPKINPANYSIQTGTGSASTGYSRDPHTSWTIVVHGLKNTVGSYVLSVTSY